MDGLIAMVLAYEYTDDTASGMGALKGDKGDPGKDGISINSVTIDKNNHLICALSNGTSIDAGVINIGASAGYNDTVIKSQIAALNKATGDINTLALVGVSDLVSAVNKLDLQFMGSINYANKFITLTYKNGKTFNIDISTIISDTAIGDLKNVDDTGIADKQILAYDSASRKYKPTTIDNTSVLNAAKQYTDVKIATITALKPKIVTNKPNISSAIDGQWYLYKNANGNSQMTVYINGVEFTMDVGNIQLGDYVNKTTDVASVFTGNETVTSKVVDIQALKDLLNIVNVKLGDKVNTTDIVDDLSHVDIDKPLSANQGYELKKMIKTIESLIQGGASVVVKKYFNDVISNTDYTFDSPIPINNCAIINAYNVNSGRTNITDTLKSFNNSTKQDFIKSDNMYVDNNSMKIKDVHELSPTLNANNLYEFDLFHILNTFDIVNKISG